MNFIDGPLAFLGALMLYAIFKMISLKTKKPILPIQQKFIYMMILFGIINVLAWWLGTFLKL
jgi:hypothetical protein